jgi:hypothetical protein
LGRSVFDFVTGKRGIDINQPSRLNTYAQLKLLLSLSNSLEPELRGEISRRLENVSLNPLENGVEAESRLAREQYEALLAYAARPDGLPAKLERDRRAELVKLDHSGASRFAFRLANVLSFGKYTHREQAGADLTSRLDIARQLAYHTRFLREVSQTGLATPLEPGSSPQVDVVWGLDEVKRSLRFVAEHGSEADTSVVTAAVRIFARTDDGETRRACLETLSQIRNVKAGAELLRLSGSKELDQDSRDLIAEYLRKAARPVERVTPSDKGANSGGPNQQ